jgi:hypothetical protein
MATVNLMATVCGERFTFGPGIASDDHLTRENAFAEMIAWLSFRPDLTADDAGHIWHVTLHGLWKTDLVPTQHDFCRKISAAMFDFPDATTRSFIRAFFVTTSAEWGNLDKWRVNKFLILVRYFVDELVSWARQNGSLDFLTEVFELVLGLKTGVGLQLQFIDVIAPYLPDLVQNTGGNGVRFARPFTALFANSLIQHALVKRINEKIVQPMIATDGESLFGSDSEAALKFMRGLLGMLNATVKKPEGSDELRQLRFDTIKQLKLRIASMLEKRRAAGEPPAKEIPE